MFGDQMAMNEEPFVTEERVAEFLSVPVRKVLEHVRSGVLRAVPVSGKVRHRYRFRLSEVAEDMTALRKPVRSTIPPAAPTSQRRISNG